MRPDNLVPNLFVFEDTDDISEELYAQVSDDLADRLHDVANMFSNARELGSIIHLESKKNDYSELSEAVQQIEVDDLDIFGVQNSKAKLLRTLKIAQVLTTQYDIVVTNPPYMNKMDPALKKYVKRFYSDYAGDLFSIFIFNNSNLAKPGGYSAFMTPFVWMFIKTYEQLRKFLIENKKIDSLIQMEYSAFEEATVPINTFVLKNTKDESLGSYLKLSAFKGGMDVQKDKVLEAIEDPKVDYLYRTNQANFAKIPGMPIAYWASENLVKSFVSNPKLGDILEMKVGLSTGNNLRFLRLWFEVAIENTCFHASSNSEVPINVKWIPIDKGGAYRKWYGNNDYIINWEKNGMEIKHSNATIRNPKFYFKAAFTWSDVTSGNFALRYREAGSIFTTVGLSAFSKEKRAIVPSYCYSPLKVDR